jgi:hypothetical protein
MMIQVIHWQLDTRAAVRDRYRRLFFQVIMMTRISGYSVSESRVPAAGHWQLRPPATPSDSNRRHQALVRSPPRPLVAAAAEAAGARGPARGAGGPGRRPPACGPEHSNLPVIVPGGSGGGGV